MSENWDLLDPKGPPDDYPFADQSVTLEESETPEPDASLEEPGVQDVKP
jgi:hypothetical protein